MGSCHYSGNPLFILCSVCCSYFVMGLYFGTSIFMSAQAMR